MPNGEDRRDRDQASESPRDDLAHRLDALGRDLGSRAGPAGGKGAQKSASGYGQALRLSTDFVAGVVVGAALGWGFDALFGTSPWGLIILLLLGFAAGVMNVMRTAGLVKGPRGLAEKSTDGPPTARPDDR